MSCLESAAASRRASFLAASENGNNATHGPSDARERADAELFERYQRDGDLLAREQLVKRFLPLARHLATRYCNRGADELEDLLQVASFALIKAVDRYEPDRGAAFSSFAVPTVVGELRRHFRDSGWALRVPRRIQEQVLEVNATVEELRAELGRSPTPGEVADRVGFPVEEVLDAIHAGEAYNTVSLDAPLRAHDGRRATIADSIGENDAGLELAESRPALRRAIGTLPEREQVILRMRFIEDLTQTEIAERLGISQMHVSRLLRAALGRMRPQIDPDIG
jgi:RNA polymerase sigma-B factor